MKLVVTIVGKDRVGIIAMLLAPQRISRFLGWKGSTSCSKRAAVLLEVSPLRPRLSTGKSR